MILDEDFGLGRRHAKRTGSQSHGFDFPAVLSKTCNAFFYSVRYFDIKELLNFLGITPSLFLADVKIMRDWHTAPLARQGERPAFLPSISRH